MEMAKKCPPDFKKSPLLYQQSYEAIGEQVGNNGNKDIFVQWMIQSNMFYMYSGFNYLVYHCLGRQSLDKRTFFNSDNCALLVTSTTPCFKSMTPWFLKLKLERFRLYNTVTHWPYLDQAFSVFWGRRLGGEIVRCKMFPWRAAVMTSYDVVNFFFIIIILKRNLKACQKLVAMAMSRSLSSNPWIVSSQIYRIFRPFTQIQVQYTQSPPPPSPELYISLYYTSKHCIISFSHPI